MKRTLDAIEPDWAWQRFEPSDDHPWDRRSAAHLMRRAGFAASSEQLDRCLKTSPAELVKSLVHREEPAEFSAKMQQMMRTLVSGNEPRSLTAGWLYRMLYTPHPLLEKMTLFWHGHFATSGAKVQNAELMLDQHQLLRANALGSFAELTAAISRDPAMLIYLDSTTNRKSHPNENYARELMELFCLGVGNYNEHDIQEVARCFTGWEVNLGKFRFNRFQADNGSKNVFGQSGNITGEQAVQIVLSQAAAPRFIVSKLLRFLIADADFPERLVQPLADQMRSDNLRVERVLETILGSQLFFSDLARGCKVRSPVEMALGLLTALEGTANIGRLAEELAVLGQSLFFPPNVKGWVGGKSWLNSATLIGRANLVRQLVTNPEARFGGTTLNDYISRQDMGDPERGVDGLSELLLGLPAPADSRSRLIELSRQGVGWHGIIHAISLLPEFHLC